MLLAIDLAILLIISAVIIWDYKKTENNRKLIALPLTAYFLIGLYLLELSPIHEAVIYVFTIIMIAVSFRFVYIEIKNAE